MRQLTLIAILIGLVLIVWSCAGSDYDNEPGPTDGDAPDGDDPDGDDPDEFTSAGTGGIYNDADGDMADGDDMSADGDAPEDDGEAERELIEADVYKVEGDLIYALNRYRGLVIIDFADPANLRILSRLPLDGLPYEMFVHNGVAFVEVTGMFNPDGGCYYSEASAVISIDVSDAQNPVILETYRMEGRIYDSRQVGDVVYVASYTEAWQTGTNSKFDIISINIADPDNLYLADSYEIDAAGYTLHVTASAIYVAETPEYYDEVEGNASTVHYLDISDPAGAIEPRGTFKAKGYVIDRFKLHQDGDVLAVVSVSDRWSGDVYFETFTVADPDNIARLGEVQVMQNEQLHASRFSGTRAYIVTYEQTDPLFVVDYADAANPQVLGELIIPGWSTHLEIRGDKILSVGIDDQNGWAPKVALFDVVDPVNPVELDSITLGGSYGWSEATTDWKAFKIYDDLGLILLPSSGYDEEWRSVTHRLHLIDFSLSDLAERGTVTSRSYILRGFKAGDYIASLSETTLQIIDIADRDDPQVLSESFLAGYTNRLQICNGLPCSTGASNGDWYGSNASLNLYDLQTPGDIPYWSSEPLFGTSFDYWTDESMIREQGDLIHLITRDRNYGYGWEMDAMAAESKPAGAIHTFDLSDPQSPVKLGSADIPAPDSEDDGYWYGEAFYGKLTDQKLLPVAYSIWNAETYTQDIELKLLDLTQAPEAPVAKTLLGFTPMLGTGQPVVQGDSIWMPTCEILDDNPERPLLKCYAQEVDAADPADITLGARINVPGHLIAIEDDGTRFITVDRQFGETDSSRYLSCKVSLEILERDGDRVHRLTSISLYTDDYCYYLPDDEPDGDRPEEWEPTDGDMPVDGDVVADGDSSGGGDDSTSDDGEAAKLAARSLNKTGDDETEWNFSGYHVMGDHVFLFFRDRGEGVDMVDGDSIDSDSNCESGYIPQFNTKLLMYKIGSGEADGEFTFENIAGFTPVQGGGLLLDSADYGYWGGYGDSNDGFRMLFIEPSGDQHEIALPLDDLMTSLYWSYSNLGAARIGDSLYIPMGWDGIFKADL